MAIEDGKLCECCGTTMQDGPFDLKDGPFIFCPACGRSEIAKLPSNQDISHLYEARKIVEQWPSWKKAILGTDWLGEKIVAPEKTEQPPAPPMPSDPAIRYPMMPKHTNMYGTIFGGIMLSLIDQAAFVEARKHGMHRWVTASIDKVDFVKPVRVGDNVALYTRTVKTGTKSVQVGVEVEVDRYDTNNREHVCSATVTMVAVDPNGKPIPFTAPPTIQYRS